MKRSIKKSIKEEMMAFGEMMYLFFMYAGIFG